MMRSMRGTKAFRALRVLLSVVTFIITGSIFSPAAQALPPGWSEVPLVSGVAAVPDIAIDSNNKAHVTYLAQPMAGTNEIYYMTNSSGTWTAPQFLASSVMPVNLSIPSLTVDALQKARISYRSNYSAVSSTIKYVDNVDGTWLFRDADFVSTPGYDYGGKSALAVDGTGKVHIMYVDGSYNQDLKYATSTDRINWTAVTITEAYGEVATASMALDSANAVHACYVASVGGLAGLYHATNSSGPWAVELVDANPYTYTDCSIAVDSAGKPHIVFLKNNGKDLMNAVKDAGVWNSFLVAGPLTDPIYRPRLATGPGNSLHISYAVPGLISYATASTSWGPWTTATINNVGAGIEHAIAVGPDGRVHITYFYFDGATSELRYAVKNPDWFVNSVNPMLDGIDWLNTQSGPIVTGNYVKVNGTYYYVNASGITSWNGASYNYALLNQCDQTTGIPSGPAVLSPSVVGQALEAFTSIPASAPSGWTVHSVEPTTLNWIDWHSSEHGTLSVGNYVRISGVFYYISYSGPGSWSGSPTEFTNAQLQQCDQFTGTPAFSEPGHTPIYPVLSGTLAGQAIELYTSYPSWPPHCFNMIMDGNETGIDCGGSCGACTPPTGGGCGQPGSPVAVVPGTSMQNTPSINALGEMVWSQFDPATGKFQIISSVTGTITSDSNDHWSPSINKYGDIVWEQYNSSSPYDRTIRGRFSGQMVQLTYGSNDTQPSINDSGEVVYTSNGYIYSTLRGPLSMVGNSNYNPDINNNGDVVWEQAGQIYKLPAGSIMGAVQVTTGPEYHSMPSINDSGVVVWSQGMPGGGMRLYSSVSGTVIQVTDACPVGDHMDAKINSCGDIVFSAYNPMSPATIYRLGNSSPCVAAPPPGGMCGQPGSPVAVAPGTTMQNMPSINALGEMVWSQFDPGTGKTQIISSVTGTVTSDSNDHWSPSINKYGDIVWEQINNNPPYDRTIRGRVSGQVVQFTYGTSDTQPSINDSGEVVYSSNGYIYSTLRGPLSMVGNSNYNPDINNNGDVVWEQAGQIYKLPAGSIMGAVQVTTGPESHAMPSISDSGVVVWSQGMPGGGMRLYSNVSGTVIQVTEACPIGDHMEAKINACGDIVFAAMSMTSAPAIYRLGNSSPCVTPPPPGGMCGQPGSPVAVAPGTTMQNMPSINALGEMVWSQYDSTTGKTQIVSSVTGTVTSDSNDHWSPSINNFGDIVWEQINNNPPYDRTIRGRVSGQVVQFTYGTSDTQPSINDSGEVVYGSNGQIYSTLRGQLTFDGYYHLSPDINNHGDVVWEQDGQIYKLPAGGIAGAEQLTMGSAYHMTPSINDSGIVIWAETASMAGGPSQLYSSVSGSITQVTASCPIGSHSDPDINACGDIVFTSMDLMTPPAIYRLGNNRPCFTFPAASSVTLTPSAVSAQNQGTVITFAAQGSGGSRNYEYQFWLKTGATWAMVQNFDSGLNSWTWDTGTAAVGGYQIQVRARNVGSKKLYEALKTISYSLVLPATTGLTADMSAASPQYTGAQVIITGHGSGGSGSYEYQFWLRTGLAWAMVQDYGSGLDNWTWDTTTAAAGGYLVQVRVRTAGSTKAYDKILNISYRINLAPTTALNVSLSLPSPQFRGASVIFTGEGSGGTGNYEYQFWLKTGYAWAMVQDYGSGLDNWMWDTGLGAKGSYQIQVRVRSGGSGKAYDVIKNVWYLVK